MSTIYKVVVPGGNELDYGDYDYIGVVRVYQCRRCGAEGEFEATQHGLVDEYSGKVHNCFDTWKNKWKKYRFANGHAVANADGPTRPVRAPAPCKPLRNGPT